MAKVCSIESEMVLVFANFESICFVDWTIDNGLLLPADTDNMENLGGFWDVEYWPWKSEQSRCIKFPLEGVR